MPAPRPQSPPDPAALPGPSPGILIAVWLALMATGFTALQTYSQTPGLSNPSPPQWPAGDVIAIEPGRFTLVMLAHPLCPCTQASMEELDRLLVQAREAMDAHVVFLEWPENPGVPPTPPMSGWNDSDLVQRAGRIPGVTLHPDPGGELAHRFGARTSGHAMLYGPSGRLLFQGGLTASRGHAGPSRGTEAIRAHLLSTPKADRQSDVFGCPLEDPL